MKLCNCSTWTNTLTFIYIENVVKTSFIRYFIVTTKKLIWIVVFWFSFPAEEYLFAALLHINFQSAVQVSAPRQKFIVIIFIKTWINYTLQLYVLRVKAVSQFWTHFNSCLANCKVQTIHLSFATCSQHSNFLTLSHAGSKARNFPFLFTLYSNMLGLAHRCNFSCVQGLIPLWNRLVCTVKGCTNFFLEFFLFKLELSKFSVKYD